MPKNIGIWYAVCPARACRRVFSNKEITHLTKEAKLATVADPRCPQCGISILQDMSWLDNLTTRLKEKTDGHKSGKN